MDPVVVVEGARTPMGSFQGALASLSASDLGGYAIKEALLRSHVSPEDVDYVLMGNVLSAGQGQAPARQAALKAGLPFGVGCSTVNKMCGSGMEAFILAHDLLRAGTHKVVVAGGMESMTQAPYLLPKARGGFRLGHGQIVDSMFHDGLEDAYEKGSLMGVFADRTAETYGFSREAQDAFSLESLRRALVSEKLLREEMTSLTDPYLQQDEQPTKARPEKIPHLKPTFSKKGTVTPGSSSSISDGAAALVLMCLSEAKRRNLAPLAQVCAHSFYAQEPAWFTTAPVGAVRRVLAKAGWSPSEVDLYEINEAFAVVAMAALKDLELSHDKVNVRGGACALGHPIGASGARLLVTLLYALRHTSKKRGVATLCIGGGEATAVAIERYI